MASAAPTIVFDFIKKAVVTGGANADSDRYVQEFLKQQMAKAGSGPPRPQA